MGALTTSDYAVTSDGTKIYLYYQNDTNEIREVTSSDGSGWTESNVIVAKDLQAGGSPITAYYVAYDSTTDNKSTVHVLYLDASGILHEKVRSLPQGTSWEDRNLPDDIKKAPITTSRLSSGICHDKPAGAHQWAFFEKLNESGAPEVAELRNGSHSQNKWVFLKILPEKPAAALPGTQLSTNLSDSTTHLFFQNHDGDVSEYLGGYDTWNSHNIIVTKDHVAINTPITAAVSPTADKPYVFYASKGSPMKVTVYNNGTSSEVAAYVPGTKLGAVTFGGKVYLFQKPLEHPTSVWTRVYDGGAWKLGAKVVA